MPYLLNFSRNFYFTSCYFRYAIPRWHGFPLIMRYIKHCKPVLLPQALKMPENGRLQRYIDIGQGLIHQQDLGLKHYRAGDGYHLLLSARELMRIFFYLVFDTEKLQDTEQDRKSTRLNYSHSCAYRMPSSA